MKSLREKLREIEHRKVASRSMCYDSGNQKFCILKSRLLTCRTFFRNKTFLFVKKKCGHVSNRDFKMQNFSFLE